MTTETEVWYVVQVFRKWSSLQVLGLPLDANQTPGCVGFMPIFDSYEAAAAWRVENGHESAGIVRIEHAKAGV